VRVPSCSPGKVSASRDWGSTERSLAPFLPSISGSCALQAPSTPFHPDPLRHAISTPLFIVVFTIIWRRIPSHHLSQHSVLLPQPPDLRLQRSAPLLCTLIRLSHALTKPLQSRLPRLVRKLRFDRLVARLSEKIEVVLVQCGDVILLLERVLSYTLGSIGERVFVERLQVMLLAVGALEGGDSVLAMLELGLEFGGCGFGVFLLGGYDDQRGALRVSRGCSASGT